MTITYTEKARVLLARWRGSVWKSVWRKLLVWVIAWYVIYFILKFGPWTPYQLSQAKNTIKAFQVFCNGLPLGFILGFYVSQVVSRWWSQIMVIPWPDEGVVLSNLVLRDTDQNAKAARETIARWLVLCEAMAFRRLSSRIHKRFPRLDHLVDAGLMTKEELLIIRNIKCKNTRWQLPLDWIINKVIKHPTVELESSFVGSFYSSLSSFRSSIRQLFVYDWIGIPLVYTQTVTIVVYAYFICALVAHQLLDIDFYFPLLQVIEFIFYVGWLNVALELMYPFGEDDDDIELNWILDRHAAVAHSLATEVLETAPDIILDPDTRQQVAQKMANNLTYSVAAVGACNHAPKFRARVKIHKESQQNQVEKPSKGEKPSGFWKKMTAVNMPPNLF